MEGCQPNVVTYNTLVDLYGKIGRPADAVATLDTMQMHVSPLLGVTWANQAPAQSQPVAMCLIYWLSLGEQAKTYMSGHDSKINTQTLREWLGKAFRPGFVLQIAVVGLHPPLS